MATITLDSLMNPEPSEAQETADRGTFKAETLACTITAPDGTVVAECEMDPRAFTPKPGKDGEAAKGGVGWYANLTAKDGANYRGVPLSGGLRVSVHGVKIGVGDTVNLAPESDDS